MKCQYQYNVACLTNPSVYKPAVIVAETPRAALCLYFKNLNYDKIGITKASRGSAMMCVSNLSAKRYVEHYYNIRIY